jgi:hypothetical protein
VFDLKIRNALGTNTFPESVRTPMQRWPVRWFFIIPSV